MGNLRLHRNSYLLRENDSFRLKEKISICELNSTSYVDTKESWLLINMMMASEM